MNQINFYLNNNKINPPENWRGLGIEANFEDGEFKSQQLTINNWDFVRENTDYIKVWINSGYIFEGMPFRVEEVNEATGVITAIFNGYIDLTDDTLYDENRITVKSKERYSIDWLNDTAAGFGFEYLESIGLLTTADYIAVPYIISAIPNYKESAIALVSLTLVTNQLVNSATLIIASISEVISDPLMWGSIISAAIQILQFVIMLLAAILLIKQIFDLLIQRVKYHNAIKVKTLFERGCQYLNLTFSSSTIPDDWYILPKKYVVRKNPQNIFGFNILGAFQPNEFPQNGYPKENFADFILKMKDLFNGKVLLDNVNANLRFERKDFSTKPAQYTMPPIENYQYRYNTNDFTSNLYVEFLTDVTESNTITQYKGTGYQVIQRPISYVTPEYVLMKGLKQVTPQYALGKRKVELTTVEEIFKGILEALDFALPPIINAINATINILDDIIDIVNEFIDFLETVNDLPVVGNVFNFDFKPIPSISPITYTPLANQIDNRIGMLLLEHDYFTQDKLLRLESDGKLHEEQPSAKVVYEDYYSIEIINNQWKLQDFATVPMNLEDYLKLKDNPNAFNDKGAKIKVESVIYNLWDKTASMKTREQITYSTNLQQIYNEPSGE